MDWKSHRVEALLEQALIEDRAVSDTTTNVTIEPEPAGLGLDHRAAGDGGGWPGSRSAVPGDLRAARSATRSAYALSGGQPS